MRAHRGLALLACLCLFTTGCTTQRYWGGQTMTGGGAKAKIGLVTKTDTNPYFVSMRKAAQTEANKTGAELHALAGQFDGDNEGQVTAIENLLQQGINTLLITPSTGTGVLGAIAKARQRGVLVIALDSTTDPENAADATYATDNAAAGEKQGKYLRAALGPTATPRLLMVDGTAGSTVDNQRHGGFLKGFGLADNSPAILGRQSTNGDQNKAQDATENLLQRASGINVVYTMNEAIARGSSAALAARGITVHLGTIDGGCAGVNTVKQGKYDVDVMQFPGKMAVDGVDAGVQYAKTGKKPSGFHDTGAEAITDKPVPGLPSQTTAWGAQHCWNDS